MTPWLWVYVTLFGAIAACEVYGVWFRPAKNDTISELVAYLFRTDTVAGWWALMALIGTAAVWFPGHCRRLAQERRRREGVALVVVQSDAHDKP